MAITTAMCNSFKTELLGGVHDLDTDSLKLALIKHHLLAHIMPAQLIIQMSQVTLMKHLAQTILLAVRY